MTRFTKFIAAAVFALALSAGHAAAQNKILNIGPGNNNIGPGFGSCVAVTLAGSTFVRICGNSYTAQLGGIYCNGSAWSGRGNYSLQQGGCNNGSQFLGGNLECGRSRCYWTPSPAGLAAGFRPETVYAQYQ